MRLEHSKPCDVASRVREARDEPELDGVTPYHEHYWNGLCSCLRSERRRCGSRHCDGSNPTTGQFRQYARQAFVTAFLPPPFYDDVLIFDVAGLRQALTKCVVKTRVFPTFGETHHTYDRHGLLLRGRSQWPSDGGGADRGYELSPSDCGWHLPLLGCLPMAMIPRREHTVFEVRRG